MNSGIYQIRNKIDGKIYIGQSYDIFMRKKNHFSNLRLGRHDNAHLQRAFNKYGEAAFEWSIIEYVELDKLTEHEQFHCDKHPFNNLYNMRICVDSNLGTKRSPETCAKISTSQKNRSPETRARMGAAHKGKTMSPEVRAKIGIAQIGRKHPAEVRARISTSNKGKKHSDQARAKISAAQMGKRASDETRAKLSAARQNMSLEQRTKMSIAQKNREKLSGRLAEIGRARQKPVLQIDKATGRIIRQWESAKIATKDLGMSSGSISKCIAGKLKSAGGFIWKYVN